MAARPDPTRLVAGTRRRHQGHIAAGRLAAPRRAINDEVEPAPVIWCNAWRGGAVVRVSHCWGNKPSCSGDGFPRNANPCSLEYGSSPGQQPTAGTGGTVVSQLVNHCSARHVRHNGTLPRVVASEGVSGGRFACPAVGVASKARELGDKLQRRRSR